MSQFNFPRINFHGSVFLDMPTANNGRFYPLVIYNVSEGMPFSPPQIQLTPTQAIHVSKYMPSLTVVHDEAGEYYVQILALTSNDDVNDWAVEPLGSYGPDSQYYPLYEYVSINGYQPGYWNYYGDMSIYANDIKVVGVQLPDPQKGSVTYTTKNQPNCPQVLSDILGSNLSFHEDFFDPNSKTSGVMVDVDPVGQTCTQMFYGKAGIYSDDGINQRTFFSGKPCKATFNWLSLSSVLNWMSGPIMPMSGSAMFYSTIDLSDCDPALQDVFNSYAGQNVTKLCMKIMVHQVYESRNPDYSKMPVSKIGNNRTEVHKNPAQVSFTGSITPWLPGDMTTNFESRILKTPVVTNVAFDPSTMIIPNSFGTNNPIILISDTIQFAPAFLNFEPGTQTLSLDLTNAMAGFGTQLGSFSPWAGPTTVPPFTAFENYDFGQMNLYFKPDNGSDPRLIDYFTHTSFYNMQNFLATGGVLDLITSDPSNFLNGTFYIQCGSTQIFVEDEYLILSDQQGTYAEQNQATNLYMSDGLPLEPVIMRAFYRGQPISMGNPVECTVQSISMENITVENSSTPINLYDGMPFQYPVNKEGCWVYGFAVNPDQMLANDQSNNMYWLANGYFITSRVLPVDTNLLPYINGALPVTWDVVLNNVLLTFKTVVPIMSVILPFEEAVWSDPSVLRKVLMLTDEKFWQYPMYMPITREMSAMQRKILQIWANQILSNPSN